MRVFKFGGASVKDAKGVKNLAKIVAASEGELLVVVSAMGKTTNALEELVRYYFSNNKKRWDQLKTVKNYHLSIVDELFDSSDSIHTEIDSLFFSIEDRLSRKPSMNYDFEYDQLVAYGEILSTKIVSAWLNKTGIQNRWMDIRFALKTSAKWRDAAVDWDLSSHLISETFNFKDTNLYLTQGFIGATTSDLTTTLGREGSDYTAAILGKVLKAEKVEVWKDVPGILNADPQYFDEPVKIDRMSYREAVELTFFGAKVIHPKTIKPLENSGIPLHVRSFLKPKSKGTLIGPEHDLDLNRLVPVFILKRKQVLITVSQPDFSFMDEKSMERVFGIFADLDMNINLMQHSALKLSVSVDLPERGIMKLIEKLAGFFEVRYNDGLDLITIRHYTPEAISMAVSNRTVYVEQKTRRIARFLVKAEKIFKF
jgi:aspartate kinase